MPALHAFSLLEGYDWPGNVRELQATVRYALLHASGELLTLDCLPESVRGGNSGSRVRPNAAAALDLAGLVADLLRSAEGNIYRVASLEADRVILETVLRHVRGNQVQASELLGISRTTLRAKLRALGMTVEKQLLPEAGRAG